MMLTLGKPQDTVGYARIQIPYKGENQIHITASVHQGVSWRRKAKSCHAAQNAETLSAAITEIRTDIDKQLDSNYLTNCFHCSAAAAVAVATANNRTRAMKLNSLFYWVKFLAWLLLTLMGVQLLLLLINGADRVTNVDLHPKILLMGVHTNRRGVAGRRGRRQREVHLSYNCSFFSCAGRGKTNG